MKKLSLLVLVLMAGTMTLFAQNKPESGFGFVFGVTGINNIGVTSFNNGTLGFRYRMTNGMTARINANLTMTNTKNESESGGWLSSTTNKSMNVAVALGVQKSFEGTDNLDPYLGIELGVGNVGGGSVIMRNEVTNADSTGLTVGDFSESTTKNASGIGFSLRPLIGFEYFFLPKFSFGAEFGWGLAISSTKGGEVTTETKFNGVTTTTTVELNNVNKSTSIGTSGSGSVMVGVYF
jgi:hypothetical protein